IAANGALALKPGASYALVEAASSYGGEEPDTLYLVAEELVGKVFADTPHEVLKVVQAEALAGVRYQPLLRGRFDDSARPEDAWRVVLDDFVTLEDGTGIVHIAPAYGDLEQGRVHSLPTIFSVGLNGLVLPEVGAADGEESGPYAGMWF